MKRPKRMTWMCLGVVAGACIPAGPATIVTMLIAGMLLAVVVLSGLLAVMEDRRRVRQADCSDQWLTERERTGQDDEAALLTTGPGGEYTKRHESDSIGELLGGDAKPQAATCRPPAGTSPLAASHDRQ